MTVYGEDSVHLQWRWLLFATLQQAVGVIYPFVEPCLSDDGSQDPPADVARVMRVLGNALDAAHDEAGEALQRIDPYDPWS